MDCIISFPTIEYFSKIYSEEILIVAENFKGDFNNMVKDEKITNINNYSGRLIGFDIPILLSPKSGYGQDRLHAALLVPHRRQTHRALPR